MRTAVIACLLLATLAFAYPEDEHVHVKAKVNAKEPEECMVCKNVVTQIIELAGKSTQLCPKVIESVCQFVSPIFGSECRSIMQKAMIRNWRFVLEDPQCCWKCR